MRSFNDFQRDILGQVIAEERKRIRDEIQTAIGELRAEFNVQRAAEKADVIDLPGAFWKRDVA